MDLDITFIQEPEMSCFRIMFNFRYMLKYKFDLFALTHFCS